MRGAGRSRGRAAWIVASALIGLGAVGVALAVLRDPSPPPGCETVDRRVGVAHRPDGWTAEARYQRWFAGGRCHGQLAVALYAPGGTWEDEALEAAALVGVEDVLPDPGDGARWVGDELRMEGHTLEVRRLPGEDDPGDYAWRQERLAGR
ncbi:MAG: hypothetical protein VYE22_05150 [Myxococcota bacterium]|nr:hypothetical protein [Myxococcota bacterium]